MLHLLLHFHLEVRIWEHDMFSSLILQAPGVDILAAYTLTKSLTGLKGDTQHSKFTLMSGTSICRCCSLRKIISPDLDTGRDQIRNHDHSKTNEPEGEQRCRVHLRCWSIESCKSLNPGLVYDIDEMSYVQFLCHEGYSGSSIAHLVGTKSINCSSILPGFGYDALNYPSMQLNMKNGQQQTVGVFRRRVTNVGPPSVYNATIKAPKGVQITVRPMSLLFTRPLQKRSFKVAVRANLTASSQLSVLSSSLVWKSGRHTVRSPVVVYNLSD